jgi:hypothetical protein
MARAPREMALTVLAACALGRGVARAQGSVDLYTMGPGRDVFSRYGHASLCVRDAESPDGRCYNYGTTDFSTPVPLTWSVLRGRARFWVSLSSRARMEAWYGPEGEDRTLWRQPVALSPAALARLEQRLRNDMLPGSREYVYHHFRDNCTTRLRDHLDAVTDGALRRGTGFSHGETWRTLVLDGLASSTPLLVAGELLLGRPLDRAPTRWEAMFLPAVLRAEVARALGSTPVAVHTRADAAPVGDRARGRAAIVVAALALALASWPSRTRRTVRALGGLAAGLAGLVVWTLALASSLPELAQNDLRAVLLPTDLVVGALRGETLVRYARARLVMALLASLAQALGLTPQPLAGPALFVAVLMAPWAMREATRPAA